MNENASQPTAMPWHIFKKDWKLLWPLALVGAASQALLAVLRFQSDASHGQEALSVVLTLCLVIAIVLLIVLAVQQDAIPGVSQDWLVRPIKRRDLLLAKLLIVALLIHGPMVASNLALGLAEGFSLGSTLRATLLSTFEVALVFTLPVMAIAAMTKSLTEALIGSLAIILGLILMYLIIARALHLSHPVEGTGVAWVWRSLSHLVLLLVTATVLLQQYFRRSTRSSRVLFAAGLIFFMLIPGLPWRPAFAIQRWLSANPDADHPILVEFDPAAGPQAADDSVGQPNKQIFVKESDEKEKKTAGSKDTTPIFLPLRISGLPRGLSLHADRSVVRLVDADGEILYRGTGHIFDLLSPSGGDGQILLRQAIEIPAAIYRRVADRAVQLEVDYSLTLLRPHALPPLSALNGHRRLPGMGHCTSKMNHDGTAIVVSCRAAGELPMCMSMVLEHAASGRRNPEKFDCELNYQPTPLRFYEDAIDHAETKLPFGDAAGAALFPVGPAQLRDAQVVLSVFEPEDHFSRRIVVPHFRLRDWEAAPPPAGNRAPDGAPPVTSVRPKGFRQLSASVN
jgi:hypothetical protein